MNRSFSRLMTAAIALAGVAKLLHLGADVLTRLADEQDDAAEQQATELN